MVHPLLKKFLDPPLDCQVKTMNGKQPDIKKGKRQKENFKK